MSAVSSPARARTGAVASASSHDGTDSRHGLLRWLPLLALGLLVAAAAAYVQRIGWQTTTFTNDELWGVVGGRYLERDFFGYITDFGHFNRGPERLVSVLQVLPNLLLSDTADELRAIHVLLALAYFSTCVPVYLLARGVGLARWQAALVGALVIVTPWIVFGATTLTVTVALPANTWFAYAAWRAAVKPSLWGDVLVLAAAALNTLSRTGHAPFTVVALLAVVYAVWLRRPAGEPVGRALLRLPLRVTRQHPLIVAVMVLAALVVLRLGISTVVGSAYESASNVTLPWDSIWLHLRDWFVQLTMATGYLPVMVGVPWLLWQLFRPASAETGVLAVVALGMWLVFVYITSTHNSVSEERYVAVLAGLPIVAFGAAVFRREAWPLGTLVIGLLAARAIATMGPYVTDFEGYVRHQVLPARLFFQEVLIGRVTVAVPGGDTRIVLITTLLLVAIALLVALLTARRPPARLKRLHVPARRASLVGGACAGLVLLLGVSGATWAVGKYQDGLPEPRSIEAMDWVDEATVGGRVFVWSHFAPRNREDRIFLGLQAIYFNEAACCNLWINDVQDILGPDQALPGEPAPRYLLRPEAFVPLGFAQTTLVAQRAYGNEGQRLERFDGPVRAAMRAFGALPDGTLPAGDPVKVELYAPAREAGCAEVEVIAPPEVRPMTYRVTAGGRTRERRLLPGGRRTERVPTSGGLREITITATAGPLLLGDMAAVEC